LKLFPFQIAPDSESVIKLRLGEGTGACLALPVLQASAKVLREMATFDSAGVTEK